MYRLPCLRTLDRPILIFGLEPEDLLVVTLVASILMFAVDPVAGPVVGGALWIGLKKVKGGKPAGYLYALLYRIGLLSIAPPFVRVPHLVRAPLPGQTRILRFSAAPGDADEDTSDFRFYHHEKPRIS